MIAALMSNQANALSWTGVDQDLNIDGGQSNMRRVAAGSRAFDSQTLDHLVQADHSATAGRMVAVVFIPGP